MKTITVKNQSELHSLLKTGSEFNIKIQVWEDFNVDLTDAKIEGSVDLRGVEIEGDVSLRNAKIGGGIIQTYTEEDLSFLRTLPLDIIDLSTWQSNQNWKNAQDIHTCGTTYCVRGYAEVLFYKQNGEECQDKNTLYPNLKHLFHMTNKQFKVELQKILK